MLHKKKGMMRSRTPNSRTCGTSTIRQSDMPQILVDLCGHFGIIIVDSRFLWLYFLFDRTARNKEKI